MTFQDDYAELVATAGRFPGSPLFDQLTKAVADLAGKADELQALIDGAATTHSIEWATQWDQDGQSGIVPAHDEANARHRAASPLADDGRWTVMRRHVTYGPWTPAGDS